MKIDTLDVTNCLAILETNGRRCLISYLTANLGYILQPYIALKWYELRAKFMHPQIGVSFQHSEKYRNSICFFLRTKWHSFLVSVVTLHNIISPVLL